MFENLYLIYNLIKIHEFLLSHQQLNYKKKKQNLFVLIFCSKLKAISDFAYLNFIVFFSIFIP